jgi:hypothetical protein
MAPSIHLLRCACCGKCKAAPPIFSPSASSDRCNASMHAFGLLLIYACSCHSYFTLTNPQPPSSPNLALPSLLVLFRTVARVRSTNWPWPLHGRRRENRRCKFRNSCWVAVFRVRVYTWFEKSGFWMKRIFSLLDKGCAQRLFLTKLKIPHPDLVNEVVLNKF